MAPPRVSVPLYSMRAIMRNPAFKIEGKRSIGEDPLAVIFAGNMTCVPVTCPPSQEG